MKTRITNLLTATIWLLITTVWLPTFWTLAQLPWTVNEGETSAMLRYVDDDLGTVGYTVRMTYFGKICFDEDDWLCSAREEMKEREGRVYSTSTGSSFIPLVVFTLICLAGQYLLMGKVTLRFIRGKNDEEP